MLHILVVDDESIIRAGITRMVHKCLPDAYVHSCGTAEEAYEILCEEILCETPCEIVFCDICLPGTDGVTLAERIRELAPETNIIFTTAYPEFTDRAMAMHASGYILKPVTMEKILNELQDLRYPISGQNNRNADNVPKPGVQNQYEDAESAKHTNEPKIYLRAFGNFEVFCDGKPLQFKYAKTKEMLAYMTDRQGAQVDSHEIQALLWENATGHESYYKQLRKDLFDTLRQEQCLDILIVKRGSIGILQDKVKYDYYDYLKADREAMNRFRGEYMSQYSWGESTLAGLLRDR